MTRFFNIHCSASRWPEAVPLRNVLSGILLKFISEKAFQVKKLCIAFGSDGATIMTVSLAFTLHTIKKSWLEHCNRTSTSRNGDIS